MQERGQKKKAPQPYISPSVTNLGPWNAVTLQNSIPCIPIGPGGSGGGCP